MLLASLGGVEAGLGGRLVRAMVRGVTLGGLPFDSWAPVVGYIMFGATALYWVGLWILATRRIDVLGDEWAREVGATAAAPRQSPRA